MKTKILFLIFCFITVAMQAQQDDPNWEFVCSLVGENLCKVRTYGSDTVFVVGEKGLIAISTDKGVTWDKKYFSNNETLNDIVFCNPEIGFIVGNKGTILKTQDAGSSWMQMTSGTTQDINAIAAFDLNNIWVVGNNGLIMNSVDAGETWVKKSFLSDDRNVTEIKCKGSRGYIAGQGSFILHTEDAGIIWNSQILTEYDVIPSLSITEDGVYALGGGVNPYVIYSEDNLNWRIAGTYPMFGSSAAIYFQNDQKGFVASFARTTCGDCGMGFWIYKTTDGGNSWEEVYAHFFTEGNSTQSNFAFSPNNEFGYCVLGKRLVRSPYTGEFENCKNYDGIIDLANLNPALRLNQQGNELQISADSKMIERVEFMSIDGIKIIQKFGQTKTANINVSNLPKGTYLIHVLFSDKTQYSTKWIKN